MNILITGANLINKGAQSMLFVTVDQLKRIFPSCRIYYATYRGESVSKYNFERLYFDTFITKAVLNDSYTRLSYLRQAVKNVVKYAIRKSDEFNNIGRTLYEIKKINLILDISGYALSDNWPYVYNQGYLNKIRIAKKLNIPICILPQSFGPFQYEKSMDAAKAEQLKSDIRELFCYPTIVFAREVESKKYLEELGVKNVILSNDLVLQSGKIDYTNIFKSFVALSNRNEVNTHEKKVAIIPNQQISKRGLKDILVREYSLAVELLSKKGYKIFLMRHSGEDTELCEELYKKFRNVHNLCYINKDFDCIEYSEYIRDFDLVISSRFHAAVHALKEVVPVIAVGWAVKYKELMESVNQGKYSLDIRGDFCTGVLKDMVADICDNLEVSKKSIAKNIQEIQSHCCFDLIKAAVEEDNNKYI